MWISLSSTLLVILLIKTVTSITKQPPCCTGIFSRSSFTTPNNWHKGLQEAVFHSLAQHSAFDGSLDDRVERDRRLWKRIQAAEFSPELSTNKERQTGLLVNAEHTLEFHPSSYTCHERECKKSIMAIWEMRKTDHPRGYYIIVKLPVSHTYIQDSYEYTTHDGLKHLGVENIHKQHIYHYTIGTDGKHNFKPEQRRIYKPIKFPLWNKPKNDYDVNKKDFNNINKKFDSSKEDDNDDDQIVRIEPRRTFPNRSSFKPKKQGLVVAYIPENSQKEFQIPDQKYDGFLPLIHALSKQTNVFAIRDTSNEKEYDVRQLKVYEDVIKKYIEEQQSKQRVPSDFHPSKPYIQYSEPDPLYIRPSFETPNEEQKPSVDENKFLIIHKYPDSVTSQLPIGNTAGAIPTVPYISVTVSNKIPVQNINNIDLSTTTKSTLSTTTTTQMPTSEPIINTTNIDVELITITNNTVFTTRIPPKNVATNVPSADVSQEELTTTVQPTTTLLIKSNSLEISHEEDITSRPIISRNIIKKDIASKTGNRGNSANEDHNSSESNKVNSLNKITETIGLTETPIIMSTTTTHPLDEITVTAKIQIQNMIGNETKQDQLTTENADQISTQMPGKNTMKQNLELLTTEETPALLPNFINRTSKNIDAPMNFEKVSTTEGLQSTTQQTTMENISMTTTMIPETTTNNYYEEEARSQLADLFASITFDLFNAPLPDLVSEEDEPINYGALLSSSDIPENEENTNYDDFLNEELAEPSNTNQQRSTSAQLVNKKLSKTVSKLRSSRRYTNSH